MILEVKARLDPISAAYRTHAINFTPNQSAQKEV